jgi:Right handed beta helix region
MLRKPFRLCGLAVILIVSAIALAPAGAAGAVATSVTVCPAGPPTCDYATIQEALDAVDDGDSILVAPGTYAGGFTIDKRVKLLGSGASQTTISGGDPATVTISPEQRVTIESVTITDGTQTGVVNFGTLTLRDSVITDNATGLQNSGTALVADTSISDNHSFGIGGVGNTGSLTVRRSVISGNGAREGGGINNSGDATIVDSTIEGNFGFHSPGGILNTGTMDVRRATVSGNEGIPGGIGNLGSLTLRRTAVTDNHGRMGGIINGGSLILRRSIISRNLGDGPQGVGGLRNEASGHALLVLSAVTDNTGFSVGGIYNDHASLTLSHSIVTRNTADGDEGVLAGGIFNDFGTLLLRHSAVFGNIPNDCVGC